MLVELSYWLPWVSMMFVRNSCLTPNTHQAISNCSAKLNMNRTTAKTLVYRANDTACRHQTICCQTLYWNHACLLYNHAILCQNKAWISLMLCQNKAWISLMLCQNKAWISLMLCQNKAWISLMLCQNKAWISLMPTASGWFRSCSDTLWHFHKVFVNVELV